MGPKDWIHLYQYVIHDEPSHLHHPLLSWRRRGRNTCKREKKRVQNFQPVCKHSLGEFPPKTFQSRSSIAANILFRTRFHNLVVTRSPLLGHFISKTTFSKGKQCCIKATKWLTPVYPGLKGQCPLAWHPFIVLQWQEGRKKQSNKNALSFLSQYKRKDTSSALFRFLDLSLCLSILLRGRKRRYLVFYFFILSGSLQLWKYTTDLGSCVPHAYGISQS